MPRITDNRKIFLVKLQALYAMEKELEKAIPKMEKAAMNHELKACFTEHLAETQAQTVRLEDIFDSFSEKPKKLKSEGIRSIIEDCMWVMAEVSAPDAIRDAMLASSARYIEHYEMAGYMSAIDEAEHLDLPEASTLLKQTLEEEKRADETLAIALKDALEQTEEALNYAET